MRIHKTARRRKFPVTPLPRIVYILLFLILLVIFTASFSRIPDEQGREVTDEAGRTVVIPGMIDSVISLSPANTEILFAIGAGDMVAGVTEYCNYPPDVLNIPKVGGFADVNRERIAALNPDIIFASHLHISRVVPALEQLGFPVVVINPVSVHGVFDSIRLTADICGKKMEAGILVSELNTTYNEITEKIGKKERIPVFWELSDDLWTIGKGSYIDDLISKAGGLNIAGDLDAPWLQLSSEYILDADPAIIFLADHPYEVKIEELAQRPGWDSLSAVRNNRIVEVTENNNDIVSRPGPRVIQALEYITKHLYPDLF
jgi:iron complex transport system substrate-binding protein